MNRRELFALGGAGVVGLLLPQKLQAVSGAVLEGLSDEEMAQLIAKFPQGPKSALTFRWRANGSERSHVWKLELLEVCARRFPASWWLEGMLVRAKSSNGKLYYATPDVRILRVIEFYYATDSDKEEDMFVPDLIFRRRNGLWFGMDLR